MCVGLPLRLQKRSQRSSIGGRCTTPGIFRLQGNQSSPASCCCRVGQSAQMCYLWLNATFEEDMDRVQTLKSLGIRPYIMPWKDPRQGVSVQDTYDSIRLRHLTRWVNAPKTLYKSCSFADYEGWIKAQEKLAGVHIGRQHKFAL